MGAVYLAEHNLMGRKVAVKTIHAELARDPSTVERFLTEARSVNDIRHPNIVEVTDFGQANGTYYLIMELLEGETLGDRLDRVGVLSPSVASNIAVQVAAALHSAHERGFVHRDLKPDNIFLTAHPDYPDYVKVLDFGITKLIGREAVGQTQTGSLVGTPRYMSPEQCQAVADIDARSDIYALGVVLYEMVTGTVPFSAESFAGLILAHISEAPLPPREMNPDVPSDLSVQILRALEKKPEARWPTMRAFREVLLGVAAGVPRTSSPELTRAPLPAPRVALQATVAAPRVSDPGAIPAATATAVVAPGRVAPVVAPAARTVALTSHAAGGLVAEEAVVLARAAPEVVKEQRQRVSNKLARIVIEKIQANTLVLPTMPEVALKCLDQLADERHTSKTLADTLARDPLLTTQVLKVANSVMFGSTVRVATLEQAVARLGARQLKLILIELSARRVFESKQKRIRDAFQGMWEHSLAVAMVARDLCKRANQGLDHDSAYLAGLLHDGGKPMVGALLLEAEKNLNARDTEFMDDQMFVEVVNGTHREVGVAVAESWRLPIDVVRAIALVGRYDMTRPHSVTNYVCFANELTKRLGYYVGEPDARVVDQALLTGKTMFGLSDENLEQLTQGLAEHVGVAKRPAIPAPLPDQLAS